MDKSQLVIGMRARCKRRAYRAWHGESHSEANTEYTIVSWTRWESGPNSVSYTDVIVCYAKYMPVCVIEERRRAYGGGVYCTSKNKKGSKMTIVVWVTKNTFSKPFPVMLEDLELPEATDQW